MFFTISEFAKLSRTTRSTLLYYEDKGLLSPKSRGDNKYRYYTHGQLSVINVIRTLRRIGISLNRVKGILNDRSPEKIRGVLSEQIQQIEKQLDSWNAAKKLLFGIKASIDTVMGIEEDCVTIQHLPPAPIVLGDLIDYSNGNNEYDALLNFYNSISEKHPKIDANYPVWGVFSTDRIRSNDLDGPDRYFMYASDGYDKRAAGLYAIGYARGGYGQNKDLYKRLAYYAEACGYEVYGDAYEEYPLNELCFSDEDDYLIRVLISVREKQ